MGIAYLKRKPNKLQHSACLHFHIIYIVAFNITNQYSSTMAELFCDQNHVWINTLHLLIIVLSVIQLVGLHPTSAQENGLF